MPSKELAILTAVTLEARAIAQELGMICPSPGRSVRGRIDGMPVSVHLIGIGAVGLAALKLEEMPAYVLMAGLAGALDPTLRIGDVIVENCSPEMRQVAGVRRGTIATRDRIIADPQEKARLRKETSALAVDMENALARDWANRHGIPFLAIRSISDRADQSVNGALLGGVDVWGRPRPLFLIGHVLRNPFQIRHLIRLRRDSNRALTSLAETVKLLVQHYAGIAARESIPTA